MKAESKTRLNAELHLYQGGGITAYGMRKQDHQKIMDGKRCWNWMDSNGWLKKVSKNNDLPEY
jgi:hypothetical protein